MSALRRDCPIVSGVRRVFWIVVTTAAVTGLIYNLHQLVDQYLEYDVISSISRQTARQLEFPAVTICNQNPVRTSKIPPSMLAITEGAC